MDLVKVGGASVWAAGYLLGLGRVRHRVLIRKDPRWREMLAALVRAWGLPFGLVVAGGIALGARQAQDATLIVAAVFFWEGHSVAYGSDPPSTRTRALRSLMWFLGLLVGASLVVAVFVEG